MGELGGELKVVRESTSGDATEVKPIEIPPPRPKRKPMHPYPRKLSAPLKTGGHHARSTSPNSSRSDQENQSPTSVLSAVGSNMFGLGDPCSPNVGSSPVSSANGVKPGGSSHSEPDLSPDENVSSPPAQDNDSSNPMKLESCCDEKGFANESSPEAASTQSLKLFGKTVVITDPHQPSSPNNVVDPYEGSIINLLPHNLMPVSSLPCGAPVYYMQFLDENSDSAVVRSSTCTAPWWSLYGSLSYPLVQPSSPTIATKQSGSEMQNEGSNTGSNTGSLSLEASDRNWDVDTGVKEEEQKQKKPFLLVASERSAFTKQHRGGNNNDDKKDKCIKGFVPYKRCLGQRDSYSTGEEREEQRIRLCL